MRVLVCGSRTFVDYEILKETLDGLESKPTRIIHGAAAGADRLSGVYAERQGMPCSVFPADWNTFGRSAGPIRNTQMLVEGAPELVVAFWDGKSRGTQNMINQAEKAGIPVTVVDVL